MAARIGGMAEGMYSCHPRQMITKKPLNINDEDIFDGMNRDERPLSLPTTMLYSMQNIRLAEICRSIVDRNPLAMTHTSGLSHDAVMDIDTELQTLINEIPASYSMSKSNLMEIYGLTQAQADKIFFQGKATYFLFYSQRCKLHRPYLTRSSGSSTYSSSREICIKHARLMIQSELWLEDLNDDVVTRFKFAGFLIGVFYACIVLIMDLGVNSSSPHYEKRREEIRKSFRIMESAKNESQTTAKAVDSLIHLLRKYNMPHLDPVPNRPQSQASLQQEMATDLPETSRYSEYGEAAYRGGAQGHMGNSDDLGLPMLVEEQEFHESGHNLSAYWTEFTQNFEHGMNVDSFDWENMFLELDSSFI
jgi:hypothetical protein